VDWIGSIKSNENKALTDIYTLYRSECLYWIKQNFNVQDSDALDIFQLSVVILYDNVVSGKLTAFTADIKTYLQGIIRNKAYELVRKQQNYEKQQKAALIMNYLSTEDTPKMILEEQLSRMLYCLEKLGDPCRSLLQCFYYSGMSLEQIGRLMGYKNTDTVKNQKYKCIKRLQKLYTEHISKNTGRE
jgi:RNA polymerase sigma factor (sigma-70 family)